MGQPVMRHASCDALNVSCRAVIWRWLYTISYEQWLWSALMLNQFDGQAYSEYCHGAGSTLEAVAGLLPGPALAPPAQLATMAGACPHALSVVLPSLRAAHASARGGAQPLWAASAARHFAGATCSTPSS